MNQSWAPDFLDRSPMFLPLRHHGASLAGADWPTLSELQRVLEARQPLMVSGGGVPLRFVAPCPRGKHFDDGYEARIYLRGEVQVRPANWHDLMNALVWLTFPLAKAALNARQFLGLRQQHLAGAPNRGPLQDAMTLFDEGGVIVIASDKNMLQMLRDFRWKELFWRNRARIESAMHFYLFGHALYEKALCPYSGITARGILLDESADFFSADTVTQTNCLDALLESKLLDAGAWNSTRELAPVPILGVPGWCADNEAEAYYDDTGYFRRGRGMR
jgi:hypothetical protein